MPANWAAFLGGMLCAYGIAFCIWGLINAAILKAAVALYNTMAGGRPDRGVPSPSFGKAFVIVFVTLLLNVALCVGLLIAAEAGASAGRARAGSGSPQLTSMLVAQAISYPLGMLVLAGMVSSALPTTLGRAFLVTLCHVLIVVLIAALFGVAVVCLASAGGLR